ncbi:MAG: glutamate-1-semialdehyde 2,1-aminomutase [Gammaproteobacteria bacterium]|nr:glutamate-1-semialdehyde 2,1-aminomutase [Gammaproteobacteria bacterium]MCP4089787.1 glutamate-1-semialdehyde 2,1-aminomutase [Gammaproteobacteria bacterium]MCP4278196.1 glutamate-1-semialdehyde 2,1-aminomutase [Gammaproteobacteria bacterium]MCP4831915.1 glutamate-1-semialdehyde 2,1-aminomutase [Gammaproteobacteria bacterium]MCP4927613.1 glutamate-1-semialdehyde 2,1-aminomutase [Gammaproteobacteria bacterium]
MNNLIKSAQLFDRAKKIIPGGVHSPVRAFQGVGGTPPFIDSANGACLTDIDGNTYLDFCMSWGPLILGHQDPDIAKAANAAIAKGCTFGAAEASSLALAELITNHIPWVEKLRFVNSGTEAVMSAIRVARGATGRNKILKFDGCYHGHSDAMLVQAGSGLTEMATPNSAGVPAETTINTLVAPLNDIPAVEKIFATHGNDIAAIIIEPVPANNGLLLQQENFLEKLAAIAHTHGALVIFDEVITGFRLAFGGAAEVFGIQPDLVTYGKIIGGGFPVGAYGGRADLLDQVAPNGPVYQAGTLSGNPVAMKAGLAGLEKLLHNSPYTELEQRTLKLGEKIKSATQQVSPVPITVQVAGSLFWIILGDITSSDGIIRSPEQIPSAHKDHFRQVFHTLLTSGIYLAPSAFEVSFLSTAHTDAQLDDYVAAFSNAIHVLAKP